jgi:signal transduction histidine kinase
MMGESGRSFSHADLSCVEDLARRMAFAVENARLYHEAQEAIHAREQFLSIASHELRTPLTALQLAVQRLVGWPRSDSADSGWIVLLEKIERATKRLSSLAEDLLEVTRRRGARLRLIDLEEVDLLEVTRDVISGMQDEITRCGSSVRVRSRGAMTGHWDRRRIDLVVGNFCRMRSSLAPRSPLSW